MPQSPLALLQEGSEAAKGNDLPKVSQDFSMTNICKSWAEARRQRVAEIHWVHNR